LSEQAPKVCRKRQNVPNYPSEILLIGIIVGFLERSPFETIVKKGLSVLGTRLPLPELCKTSQFGSRAVFSFKVCFCLCLECDFTFHYDQGRVRYKIRDVGA